MDFTCEDFVPERITHLRLQEGVSARDMSLSIGQNENYINQIENKKTLPSLPVLCYICDYFHITPQQFFDVGNPYPAQLADLMEDLKKLDYKTLELVAALVRKLAG